MLRAVLSRLLRRIKEKGDPWFSSIKLQKISDEKGHGVLARKRIDRGELIGFYAGKLCKREEALGSRYAFGFSEGRMRNWVIDAEHFGNFTSCLNHSRSPNLDAYSFYHRTFPYIVFVTKRIIEENEELTFDYGDQYWKNLGVVPL